MRRKENRVPLGSSLSLAAQSLLFLAASLFLELEGLELSERWQLSYLQKPQGPGGKGVLLKVAGWQIVVFPLAL